ncbi:MAG TPA: hypothetical protein VFA78_01860 [Chloroflexota bacterium]|nr:hypothetical protein [Chloroflexota bacterium]
MAIAGQLLELENLDSELDDLDAAIADRRRRTARHSELEAAEKRLDVVRQEDAGLAKEQRDREGDLAACEARIARDQKRMYSGAIVDARELGSLEREIEHDRAQRDQLEERLLQILERRERLEAETTGLSRTANELRERWEADRETLTREVEHLTDVVAGMRAERETLSSALPRDARDLYDRLRRSVGHAVSTVNNGVCQQCRVTVPPRDVARVRTGAMVTCVNCARILYVAR